MKEIKRAELSELSINLEPTDKGRFMYSIKDRLGKVVDSGYSSNIHFAFVDAEKAYWRQHYIRHPKR